jgi:hypothetical protein
MVLKFQPGDTLDVVTSVVCKQDSSRRRIKKRMRKPSYRIFKNVVGVVKTVSCVM